MSPPISWRQPPLCTSSSLSPLSLLCLSFLSLLLPGRLRPLVSCECVQKVVRIFNQDHQYYDITGCGRNRLTVLHHTSRDHAPAQVVVEFLNKRANRQALFHSRDRCGKSPGGSEEETKRSVGWQAGKRKVAGLEISITGVRLSAMGDTGEPQAGVCPQRHALGRLRALPESLKKRTKERTASSTVAKSPTNSALQGQTGPTRANDSLMTSTNQNKAWMEKIFDPLSPTSAATSPAALQRRQEESLLPPLSANSSMSSTFGSSSLSHASAGGSYIIKPYTPQEQTPRSSPSPRRNSARTPMTPRGAGDRNRTDDAELSLQKDRSLTHSLNLIIDALSYNEMTLDGGFAAFDSDGDGRISLGEFIASVCVCVHVSQRVRACDVSTFMLLLQTVTRTRLISKMSCACPYAGG